MPSDRSGRNGEAASPIVIADQGGLLGTEAYKIAVVDPYLLYELKLARQARPDEDEHDAPLDTVVVKHTIGKYGSVRRSAPEHPVDIRAYDRIP
jgi:hypothetical protein